MNKSALEIDKVHQSALQDDRRSIHSQLARLEDMGGLAFLRISLAAHSTKKNLEGKRRGILQDHSHHHGCEVTSPEKLLVGVLLFLWTLALLPAQRVELASSLLKICSS